MTHHDRHGVGTFVTVIDGLKLWVYWLDLTDQERREFEREGMFWVGRRPSWVLLRPGDTLVMQPGYCTPHFVFTIETSTCIGGAFWDSARMLPILRSICNELSVPGMVTTNEQPAQQLPLLLREFRRMISDPRRKDLVPDADNAEYRALIERVLGLLQPCICSKGGQGRCPCQTAGQSCTVRCSCYGSDCAQFCRHGVKKAESHGQKRRKGLDENTPNNKPTQQGRR